MKYKRLNGTGTLFILSIHSNHIWVLVNFHSTSAFSWEWMKKMCSIALAKPTLVMFQKHIAYSWCSLSSTSQNHLPLILLFLCVYVFFFLRLSIVESQLDVFLKCFSERELSVTKRTSLRKVWKACDQAIMSFESTCSRRIWNHCQRKKKFSTPWSCWKSCSSLRSACSKLQWLYKSHGQ